MFTVFYFNGIGFEGKIVCLIVLREREHFHPLPPNWVIFSLPLSLLVFSKINSKAKNIKSLGLLS